MSPLQQLRAVRALLAPEGAWLDGYSFGAVDDGGRSCPVRSSEAVRWGVLAGFVRLRGPVEERIQAVELVCRVVASKWLHAWEQAPGRTQAEVLAALDGAAELALEGDWR